MVILNNIIKLFLNNVSILRKIFNKGNYFVSNIFL